MEEEKNMKRAARRAYRARVSRAARLKAERSYRRAMIDAYYGRRPRYLLTLQERYRRYMLAGGRYMNGGCPVAGCGLCQPHGPSRRKRVEEERIRQELNEFWDDLLDLED